MKTSWSSEDWCSALAEHFFTGHSEGLPVLFFVDDEVLGEIYGGDPTDAVDSISDVVCGRLNPNDLNGYFHGITVRSGQWKRAGGGGVPPFLDLLAVCVLAAARMGTGNYASNDYYSHLRDLLGIEEPGMPRGFDYELDAIWDRYTWWLDEHLDGARGLSTVVTNAAFSHVGRPQSQTLFRGSDVRRLDDFFRWLHLEPGEGVEEDFLVTYFKAWAPGQDLSAGARRLLADNQYWPTLGRILNAYAAHWDGTRSDREGTRIVGLRVVVQLRMPRRVSIRAKQPDGYPEHLRGVLGGTVASATADTGVFVVDGTPDPRQLTRGGMLGDANYRLTLAESEIFILQLDPEVGGWASVASFVPGVRHYVLATPSVAGTVWNQLERVCAEPPSVQPPLPGAFAAWSLYGDVVLQGNEALEGVLADRRPTLSHRFVFRGGLPLESHHSYLSGGAPDVWLPSVAEASLALTLDGRRISTLADRVRLARELPQHETASHVVGYGDVISRTIAMIDSTTLTPPVHDQPGHALEPGPEGTPVSHQMMANIEDAPETAVTVVGTHVTGADGRWSETPVLLHRHAQRAWLLGSTPGEVIEVSKPPKPAWMAKRHLTGHLYEARAPFTVQYSVEEWHADEAPKARQHGTVEPGDRLGEGDASIWAELIRRARLGRGDAGLWDEYRAAAELVQEGALS